MVFILRKETEKMLLPTIRVKIFEGYKLENDSIYHNVEWYFRDFTKDEITISCDEGEICIFTDLHNSKSYRVEFEILE